MMVSWRRREGWLLVMDNLDDISDAHCYLPYMERGGQTLILTRNPEAWNIIAEGVEIPAHSEDTAIKLLCLRSQIGNTAQSPERRQAAEIVKELGYLTLAIEQASAFIRSSRAGGECFRGKNSGEKTPNYID